MRRQPVAAAIELLWNDSLLVGAFGIGYHGDSDSRSGGFCSA
jgi:hypothetical protein